MLDSSLIHVYTSFYHSENRTSNTVMVSGWCSTNIVTKSHWNGNNNKWKSLTCTYKFQWTVFPKQSCFPHSIHPYPTWLHLISMLIYCRYWTKISHMTSDHRSNRKQWRHAWENDCFFFWSPAHTEPHMSEVMDSLPSTIMHFVLNRGEWVNNRGAWCWIWLDRTTASLRAAALRNLTCSVDVTAGGQTAPFTPTL